MLRLKAKSLGIVTKLRLSGLCIKRIVLWEGLFICRGFSISFISWTFCMLALEVRCFRKVIWTSLFLRGFNQSFYRFGAEPGIVYLTDGSPYQGESKQKRLKLLRRVMPVESAASVALVIYHMGSQLLTLCEDGWRLSYGEGCFNTMKGVCSICLLQLVVAALLQISRSFSKAAVFLFLIWL